jgi:hypothetical protein
VALHIKTSGYIDGIPGKNVAVGGSERSNAVGFSIGSTLFRVARGQVQPGFGLRGLGWAGWDGAG